MRNMHVAALAMMLGLASVPVAAHHSGSMFEPEKTVTMTGVVKEFQYTNPHSWLIVTVANDDGTTSTWGFEAEGPSTLLRAGIRKSDFSPGTEITITGRPMRDGRTAAYWVNAVRASDGKEFNPGAGFQVEGADKGSF
ncbi:DUF6152 family protein [Elongatibacter sediminis]|uniref:DUF6152 family protein n=1 Tax=Elongatibacter sediminis TaxID=3119006 RepID=A0AAW9RBK5_9GAMM